MSAPLPANDALKKEFVCDTPCVPASTYKVQLGKKFATALTGFVAGVIVATIMLYPWIKFLGDYCPNPAPAAVTAPGVVAPEGGSSAAPENPSGTMPAAGEPGAAPPPPGVNLEVQTVPAQ